MLWPRRWGSGSCNWLVFCCVAAIGCPLLGQEANTQPIDVRSDSASRVQHRAARELRSAVDVGWVMGISAPDFFADYQVLLGGSASGFDIPTSASLNVSSFMLSDAPVGLSVGYYKAIVRETYTYDPAMVQVPLGARQTVTQNIELTVIPAMVTFDYFPFHRQFTGYVGIGAGIGSTHVFWEEVLSASTDVGARQSGIRYDEWQIAPALAVRAGISLGFDKRLALRTRAGVYFEAGYLYVPVSGAFFEKTGQSLPIDVPRTSETYSIQAGGVTLRIGFSLLLSGS